MFNVAARSQCLCIFSPADRRAVRATIIESLSNGSSPLFKDVSLNDEAFVHISDVQMHLPMTITDYADFLYFLVHAENVGSRFPAPYGIQWANISDRVCALSDYLFRKPFTNIPWHTTVGYHLSLCFNTDVVRPKGFFKDPSNDGAVYQPSQQLDFENEFGASFSTPLEAGKNVTAKQAADMIFGFVFLNDWSSRDIQEHEMHPLGPLHSKSFLTSISPWVVMPETMSSSPCNGPHSKSRPISSILEVDGKNHGLYDVRFSTQVSRK